MSSAIIYERYLWFHNAIKNNGHPNARTLAEQFEITTSGKAGGLIL